MKANEVVGIIVYGDINELSPNRRLHYMARGRLVTAWKQRAMNAWIKAGMPTYDEKVRIKLTICRGRRIDPDNALASAKACVDGLCTKNRMVPSDSDRWVEFAPVVQLTGAKWKGLECVIVDVEPMQKQQEGFVCGNIGS